MRLKRLKMQKSRAAKVLCLHHLLLLIPPQAVSHQGCIQNDGSMLFEIEPPLCKQVSRIHLLFLQSRNMSNTNILVCCFLVYQMLNLIKECGRNNMNPTQLIQYSKQICNVHLYVRTHTHTLTAGNRDKDYESKYDYCPFHYIVFDFSK